MPSHQLPRFKLWTTKLISYPSLTVEAPGVWQQDHQLVQNQYTEFMINITTQYWSYSFGCDKLPLFAWTERCVGATELKSASGIVNFPVWEPLSCIVHAGSGVIPKYCWDYFFGLPDWCSPWLTRSSSWGDNVWFILHSFHRILQFLTYDMDKNWPNLRHLAYS
jgi:hypothetical protein